MTYIETVQTKCGQNSPYGDFIREWDIKTDGDKAEMLDYCFTSLYRRKLPDGVEFHCNIHYGAEHFGDADYYFAGYYTLKKTEYGYVFTVYEPYAD